MPASFQVASSGKVTVSGKMTINTTTPVVVIRCARHGGLGITRTLGRLGVPMYNIDESRNAPTFYSRYSKGSFVWDAERAPAEETIQFLKQVAEKIGRRPILIPTSDGTAMLVADHADELSQWYDFPRMDPALVRAFCSKEEMYHLAKRYNVPTPETLFPHSREELVQFLSDPAAVKFPVMAKGNYGIALERKSGKRMFIANTREEVLDIYDKYEDWNAPNIMLQEYIPGGPESIWMLDGYFDGDSNCLLQYTGRKIRQYPAYTGLTSLGELVRNDAVSKITTDFMKACGYRGILDLGYRYDERDGQYKLLDVNPRVGATFRLFTGANDMDVVRALYLDMTGQPVEFVPAKEGRKWLVEDCDIVSCLKYYRDGQLNFNQWLQSHKGVDEKAVFAMDDPLPAFWMGLRDLGMLWKQKTGKKAGSGLL